MGFDVWTLFAITTQFALYLGVMMSCGAVLFRMVFREAEWGAQLSVRPILVWFSVLALVATGVSYGIRAAALTGGMAGMMDGELLWLLWGTSVGTAFAFRVVGLGMMIASLLFPRGGRFLALAGVALVVWSFGQIGHATRFEFPWLAVILSMHLASVAFWVGGLWPLYVLAKDPAQHANAAALGHRFGQIAGIVVPVLLVTGAVFGGYLMGSFGALFGSAYGMVLLVKIGVVCCFIGFTALKRVRNVALMQRGDLSAAPRLQRIIMVEAMSITMILLVTAILTSALEIPE